MKKYLTLLTLLCFSMGFTQEENNEDFPRNEIKANGLLIISGYPEFSYERIIDEEMAAGVSVMFAADKNFDRKFSLTPYYRFYFGKKPAAGFYMEGFGMLSTYKLATSYYYNSYYDPNLGYYVSGNGSHEEKKYVDFALGFGLGGKWVSKKGFVFEIGAGIGRNLVNPYRTEKYYDNEHTFVGRGGITLGYRF